MAKKVEFPRFSRRKCKTYMATTAIAALGFMLFSGSAKAVDDWSDHNVADGIGSISINVDSTNNLTNIDASGHVVKVRGDGDIKAGWTVNLAQDSSSSLYALFDVEGNETKILGNLNANGKVALFNQNGVIFGNNSRVDVGSIIVSTGSVDHDDLIDGDGRFEFTGFGEGEIVNDLSLIHI